MSSLLFYIMELVNNTFNVDLHDLKRLDFHNSVFEVLRDRLVNKIEEISKDNEDGASSKLEAILEKSFPLNKIDSLLPVSMCLLKHLPKVCNLIAF